MALRKLSVAVERWPIAGSFVISRGANMQSSQAKLIAAFPKFIETYESKFADFDSVQARGRRNGSCGASGLSSACLRAGNHAPGPEARGQPAGQAHTHSL